MTTAEYRDRFAAPAKRPLNLTGALMEARLVIGRPQSDALRIT